MELYLVKKKRMHILGFHVYSLDMLTRDFGYSSYDRSRTDGHSYRAVLSVLSASRLATQSCTCDTTAQSHVW